MKPTSSTPSIISCSAPGDSGRRAAQTVMFEIVRALAGMVAPILSFLAEDIWDAIPGTRAESVFLTDFPAPQAAWRDDAVAATFDELLRVRSAVTKALEGERQAGRIKHSLEARVQLEAVGSLAELLSVRRGDLAEFFIVSEVELGAKGLSRSPVLDSLGVAVLPAEGTKCARCWNFRRDVGQVQSHSELCIRCADVVQRLPAGAGA
jgi:isoleucyl-tRNA synthetase